MSTDVELIKERLDVAEVVGEYVALKQTGHHWKGLCPFHQEKTPSFIVSPDKGIWHCFGCQEGGDIFSFVQRMEGMDFPSTLRLLAERAGVVLQKADPVSSDRRQRLFALLQLTARFYHEILMRHSAGAKAKQYLLERGVREETMRDFQLGYAPHQWDSLQQFLRTKGYAPQEMVAAGMAGTSKLGKTYDRFRGRIMFPVYDNQGRVVAFGGRIAPWHATGEEGKYVNSPETELYQKRRVVYNLHRAKAALRRSPCIVVEGYMDVVLLAQAGIPNVVASSGTAFTSEQIAQLGRHTNTFVFSFDADQAGAKALLSAAEAALPAGMRVAVVPLPAGQDPADVAQATPEEAKRLFTAPQSLIAVLLAQLKAASGTAREQQLAALVPLLKRVANPVQQGEMIQEAAAILHVAESQIAKLLAQAPAPIRPPVPVTATEHKTWPEQVLVGLLLAYPAVRRELMEQLTAEYFLDQAAQDLYKHLHSLAKSHAAFYTQSADEVVRLVPDHLRSLAVSSLAIAQDVALSVDPSQEAVALVKRLRQRSLELKLQTLQQALAEGSDVQRAEALTQFQQIVSELATTKES